MRAVDFEKKYTEVLLKKYDVDLIEVEFKKEGPRRVLRFYIDSKEGISMDDCEKVSLYLSADLDESDPIKDQYYLEVTSLGLDRNMKKDKEFENAIGMKVVLRFYGNYEGKKEVEGELLGFSEDDFILKGETEKEVLYPRKDVSSIRKYVPW